MLRCVRVMRFEYLPLLILKRYQEVIMDSAESR
jgi:hypothetical protein